MKTKVLIVDKALTFYNKLKSLLSDVDIELVYTASGSAAESLLIDDYFACVCMALENADSNAYDLTTSIRQHNQYKNIPLLLNMPAYDQSVLFEAIEKGITDIYSDSQLSELVNYLERFKKSQTQVNGRVLYIEDQAAERQIMQQMFSKWGLDVVAFEDAESAFIEIKNSDFDIVVTDIVLKSSVSGALLINKIRRLPGKKGDVPILAVTSFDDVARRISLFNLGVSDYIIKPVIEEELVARVRNLIISRQAQELKLEYQKHLNTEEIMRRAMKMEAMAKLTGGIVHDYNNMLGVISGYAELLALKLKPETVVRKYTNQIIKACENGSRLTGKLLSFVKKEPISAHTANINQIINELRPMLMQLLTASIELRFEFGGNLGRVYLDSNDFENALMNLCINAGHAMKNEGLLNISTNNKVLSSYEAEKLCLKSGRYVVIAISDNGCGMDKDIKQKIFDPFFSTKGESGTGLGMSQVYGFMSRSKGAISITSELGEGSTFELYFPEDITNADNIRQEAESNTIAKVQTSFSVLVVDDEKALANLVCEILNNAGYNAEVAYNAIEAMEKIESTQFDALVTDVIMPGENGYELASKVLSTNPDIKIVITSGYDKIISQEQMNTIHVDDKLQKPVSRERLLTSLGRLLSHSNQSIRH